MSLRLCVLASGSSGNSVFVASGTTSVLIDAGLSGLALKRRLAEIGESLERIAAVCITHEHGDHTSGLSVIQKRHKTPLYANSGTIDGYNCRTGLKNGGLEWQVFTTGQPFAIGDLLFESFSVPHDAFDPVGYIISAPDGCRVGVVTDMGLPTQLIRQKLRGCDALVVESNHDEKLLEQSNRPWSLKGRIRGRQGHLSNRQAADLLAEIGCTRLQRIFLAHISRDCNYHDLALQETLRSLRMAGHHHITVSCACPDRPTEIWEMPA